MIGAKIMSGIKRLFHMGRKRPMSSIPPGHKSTFERSNIRGEVRRDPLEDLAEALRDQKPPDDPPKELFERRTGLPTYEQNGLMRRSADAAALVKASQDKPTAAKRLIAQFTYGEMIEFVRDLMATRPNLIRDEVAWETVRAALPAMLHDMATGAPIPTDVREPNEEIRE
jgi:hypothetical protein